MSDSYNCEQDLRRLSDELFHQAEVLREAADALCTLRQKAGWASEVEEAQKRATEWFQRMTKRDK